jgi:predicted CoA-binding protein
MRTVNQILSDSKVIAIVGLSPKPDRPSLQVAQYLQERGYTVVPVNPSYVDTVILGEKVYPDLHAAADALAQQGKRIDIVDCFRKAEDIPPIARDAIAIRASVLWMQLGIVNQQAADLAAAAGLDVVMDTCIKVAHAMSREF